MDCITCPCCGSVYRLEEKKSDQSQVTGNPSNPFTGFGGVIYKTVLSYLTGKGFTNAAVLARLAVAQSKHETGNYTSAVFKNNNNAFGYKYYPGSDWQLKAGTLSPEGNSYAKYSSVENSANEIAAYINRRKTLFSFVNDADSYARVLKTEGYYGDSLANYSRGLNTFYV